MKLLKRKFCFVEPLRVTSRVEYIYLIMHFTSQEKTSWNKEQDAFRKVLTRFVLVVGSASTDTTPA